MGIRGSGNNSGDGHSGPLTCCPQGPFLLPDSVQVGHEELSLQEAGLAQGFRILILFHRVVLSQANVLSYLPDTQALG